MSNASASTEAGKNNLYEKNPDTGNINVVFADIIEKNPEKEIDGESSASGTTDGDNTITTDTEIGEISTNSIRTNGCVVMAVAVFDDKTKYDEAKKDVKERAESSKSKGKETR